MKNTRIYIKPALYPVELDRDISVLMASQVYHTPPTIGGDGSGEMIGANRQRIFNNDHLAPQNLTNNRTTPF